MAYDPPTLEAIALVGNADYTPPALEAVDLVPGGQAITVDQSVSLEVAVGNVLAGIRPIEALLAKRDSAPADIVAAIREQAQALASVEVALSEAASQGANVEMDQAHIASSPATIEAALAEARSALAQVELALRTTENVAAAIEVGIINVPDIEGDVEAATAARASVQAALEAALADTATASVSALELTTALQQSEGAEVIVATFGPAVKPVGVEIALLDTTPVLTGARVGMATAIRAKAMARMEVALARRDKLTAQVELLTHVRSVKRLEGQLLQTGPFDGTLSGAELDGLLQSIARDGALGGPVSGGTLH